MAVEEEVLDRIEIASVKLKEWAAQFRFRRYIYEKAKGVSPEYFVGIKGLRGVGKTVALLQLAAETPDSVYMSADAVYLRAYPLYEVVSGLRKRGWKTIFVDEIHSRSGWDKDVKTLFDEHEVRLVFSGSSALDLRRTAADLSRRVVLLEMKPASFREYLNIKKGFDIPAYGFDRIIRDGRAIAGKHAKAYEHFRDYTKYGGVLYPAEGFMEALGNALNKVVLSDLAYLREVSVKYEDDVYKLLFSIAQSPPFEVSYSSLSEKTGINKNTLMRMVADLCSAGVLKVVYPCGGKGLSVRKEPKLYFSIPYRQVFAQAGAHLPVGAEREEFFVNHVDGLCYLKGKRGEKTPDFRIGNITIEVGGAGKTSRQRADYIAVDGLGCEGNRIPLFLFGFVY